MKISTIKRSCQLYRLYQSRSLLLAMSIIPVTCGPVQGADPSTNSPASNEELLKKIEAMDSRIKSLESQVQHYQSATNVPAKPSDFLPGSLPPTGETEQASVKKGLFGLGYRSQESLRIGSYGELKFGSQDSSGGWQNGFDAGRIVLL